MSHLGDEKDVLLKRIRRISGQVQAIERALESDAPCGKTLHLVAAARGALSGLLEKIIEEHAKFHVADPNLSNEERQQGVQELLTAIRQYSK